MEGWSCLKVSRDEVEIGAVLPSGQSFRWKSLESDNAAWIGVFAHKVWILKQLEEGIYFKTYPKNKNEGSEKDRALLHNYFQLDVSLSCLYKEWAERDDRFAKLTVKDYQGIRILNQDCVENVFSFICSSNNNISRISQMVEKLALFYGDELAVVEGKQYFDFPKLENLMGEEVEKKLRTEKFGYRAGYITKSASTIVENGGDAWLEKLKGLGYEDARKQLQTLTGIGRKVADCICLMSLGYHEAIPVDTHIHQVAIKYLPHLAKQKTLTDKSYSEITSLFKDLHGSFAGWAQSVLFTSTLKAKTTEKKKIENGPSDLIVSTVNNDLEICPTKRSKNMKTSTSCRKRRQT